MATRTPKRMAGDQRRSLSGLHKKLMDMSAEWNMVDEHNATLLRALADHCEQITQSLCAPNQSKSYS